MDFRDIESFLGVDTNEAEELGRLLADTLASDLKKIRQSIRNNDLKAVCFVAHSMKGTTGNLGFSRPSNIAEIMETRARGGSLDDFPDLLLEMQTLLEELQGSLPDK